MRNARKLNIMGLASRLARRAAPRGMRSRRLHAFSARAWRLARTWVCITAISSASAAAQEFPYVAYVAADEVYVRSGPGKNYYPTAKLDRGDVVEVYRHDPGGWFAIRPPEGSFSWVSCEFVNHAGDGVGGILGERVAVRVGSALSDIRDVIQVRLNQGDELEMLDPRQFEDANGQVWYKVAPPAGEFRWVHGGFLARAAGNDEAVPRRASLASPDDWETRHSQRAAGRHDRLELQLADHQEPPREPDAAHGDRGDAELAAPRRAAEPDAKQPATREEALGNELDALDLELSAIVAGEPAAWDLEDIRARANDVLDRGETAIERGRARLLINKIEKFSDIKRRLSAVSDPHPAERRSRAPLAPASPPHESAQEDFDGVGRLARVHSPRQDIPNYALTDGSGTIRYFVTPAPGINLRHYVGRQVGITGNIGYVPELDRQNVIARRVTVLGDEPLRR